MLRPGKPARADEHLAMMTQWIGAIILLAAAAFIVFAFRQGTSVKPDKRLDNSTQRHGGWWDSTGT
jgi:hypothetical protein